MQQYKFTNMDLYHSKANEKWDFNDLPYRFSDDTFDAVFARHTLEHVRRDMFVNVMKEIHRVAKEGATVYIRVPYWNSESYAGDPTHWNMFCETTFRHFCYGGSLSTEFYVPPLFEMVSIEHRFHPKLRLVPKKLLKELMHILSGICDEMWVVLKVVKSDSGPVREYEPKRTYAFNRPVQWRYAFAYGALLYGVGGVVFLALLDLVLRFLGLL